MIAFEDAMQITRGVSSETAFDDTELRALYDLLLEVPKGGIVTEIGCQIGRSSSLILQCARDNFLSVHIDPWTVQPDFAAQWHDMAWKIGVPHVVYQMRTEDVLNIRQLPPFVDLLLIDGDHTEAGLLVDVKMAEYCIRFGGILCAHDYGRDSLPDVERVLSKSLKSPYWNQLGLSGTLGCWRRL
jgi:predicted O-methyltransferase YrrM